MIARKTFLAFVLAITALVLPAAARADFGLVPGSFQVAALNKDGTPDTRAATHPYEYTVHFDFNTEASGHTEGGSPRDAIVDLPPGFVGNPKIGRAHV